MTRPLQILFPGAIYHTTSRWNAKQEIFLDERYFNSFFDGSKKLQLDITCILYYECKELTGKVILQDLSPPFARL